MSYRFAPDSHFIRFWFLSARGVDDEVNLPVLNPVDNIRSALPYLEYALNRDPIIHQDLGCSLGQGTPGGLADKRPRPGASRIDLQDGDDIVLDSILNIHQPHDLEF